MNKISQQIQKWKNFNHKIQNEQELKKIEPIVLVYDMCHQFVLQETDTKNAQTTAFFDTLYKQPFVGNRFFSQYYPESNPGQQVARHGIIFNALFNVYMQCTQKSFDNAILYYSQMEHMNDKIIIDSDEYNKIPKRYRDAFIHFDDYYMLNCSYDNNVIITYSNKNKQKLEQLLYRANTLIPAVYQEDKIHNTGKTVSDQELKTIRILRDTFMEISKITFPVSAKKLNNSSGAKQIYDEYKSAMLRHNQYTR